MSGSVGSISVEFLADISDLVSSVEQVIQTVGSVAESASGVGELASAATDAASALGELATAGAGAADIAPALDGASSSAQSLGSWFDQVIAKADELGQASASAAELGQSLSEAATEAGSLAQVGADAATVGEDMAQAGEGVSGFVSTIQGGLAQIGESFQGAIANVQEFATNMQESMAQAGTSMLEASQQSAASMGEMGAGIGGAFDGVTGALGKVAMPLMATQMGFQMVQGAVQQATQPFGNFEEQMTSMVTGAGESLGNLTMIGDGVKQMAIDTGTSTDQLNAGLYMIESAGYHGADGLKVLQAEAEGAKVGSADLGTVANAVTSDMNAYGQSGKDAAADTNQLIATVAAGKMHMSDLANSLSAVLPVAAAAHISYAQVGGAIATMTAQGTTAQQATQNLANTIRALQSPNAQAVTEMTAMGLSANQVSLQLGTKGLSGTLQEVSQAVLNHMGPAGLVLQSAFKNSTNAMQDAKIEIAAMPKSLQAIATAYLNGTVSQKDWSAAMKGLDPIQQHMMTQFTATAKQTESFNQLLTKGGPSAQTYTAAMSKILGGATGLNTALQLTGTHMSTFQANVTSISNAAKGSGDSITGWKLVQQDFNQQMAVASEKTQVFWINVGQHLAPVLLSVMNAAGAAGEALGRFAGFLSGSSPGAIALKILLIALAGAGIGALLTVVPAMIIGLWGMATAAWGAAAGFIALNWPIMLIVAAIALLVVGIILAIQHWSQIAAFFRNVWGAVAAWFVNLWNGIVAWFHSALSAVGSFFTGIWNGIVGFFEGVWNRFQGIIKAIGIALAIMFAPLLLGIALIVAPFVGLFLLFTHFQQVTGALHAFLQAAWNAIVHVFQSAVQTVVGWFSWLYNHNYYFQALVDTIRKVIGAVVTWFENAWKTTVNNVVAIWNDIKAVATVVWNAIVVGIMAVITTLKGWIETFWNDEVAGWTRIWNTVKGIFSSVWNNIVSFLTGIWNTIKTDVTGLWNKISSIFSGAWNTYIASPMASIAARFTTFFTGLGTTFLNFGGNLMKLLAQGITNGVGAIGSAIHNGISGVLNGLGFHGIPGFASGVNNYAGGLAVVGEQGPELMYVPQGANIYPNGALPDIGGAHLQSLSESGSGTSGGAGASSVTHVHVYLDGQEVGSAITPHVATQIVSAVRANGPVGRAA